MGTEKNIEKNIRKKLENLGFLTQKIHVGQWGPVGFPDLLVSRDGITSFFEVKAPGKVPDPIQVHRMKELREVGCVARTVWSFEDAIRALQEGGISCERN